VCATLWTQPSASLAAPRRTSVASYPIMRLMVNERGGPVRWTSRTLAGLVASAATWTAGCSGVNTYSTHTPPPSVNLERVIRDGGLASDVQIEAIPPIDRGAGAKTAQITMRNLGGTTRTFEMRIDWFDRDGASQTGSTVAWRSYTLTPGEVREATFTGGARAEDYRLSVRGR
jgi:hypothetical protein